MIEGQVATLSVAILSSLVFVIVTLFKYSLVTSLITLKDEDYDESNFFYRRLKELKEKSQSLKSSFYVLSIISSIVSIISFWKWLSSTYGDVESLFLILVIFFILHFILYAISITYPILVFSIVYYFYQSIEKIFFPIIFIYKLIETFLFKLLHTTDKYIYLTPEERNIILSLDENIALASSESSLDKDEIKMIHSIFEFKDTIVKEIMVPRIDIKALSIDLSFDQVLKSLKDIQHSRIPIYQDNIDNIKGILYVKDLIKLLNGNIENNASLNEIKWQEIIREPYFIPLSKKIDDLLKEFKLKKIHIAVVVDEFGGTAGIVTLEDILEEIVGDIEDEFDKEEQEVTKINQNTYIVEGDIHLSDLEDETSIKLHIPEDSPYDTLSGFILEYTDTVPEEGFEFEKDGYRFKIIKREGPKIQKVRIEKLEDNQE